MWLIWDQTFILLFKHSFNSQQLLFNLLEKKVKNDYSRA